jgi:hypothetical protein
MKKSKIKEKNKNIKPITINIERDEEDGNPTFKVENCFYGESFLKYHFVDDKELTRYIKKVEFMVRSSNEYKAFIGYLKQELSINHCTILNKLNDSTVSVEMHHIPFTLYDIVNTIILFYLSKEKGFNTFSIASDVMRLHYENMIGLVPLSKTIHELDVIDKYHLNVITVIRKREKTNLLGKKFIIKESIGVPFGTTVFRENDILVVFGKTKDILVYCNE